MRFNFWGQSTLMTWHYPLWFLGGTYGGGSEGIAILNDQYEVETLDSTFHGKIAIIAHLQAPQTVPVPAGFPMLFTALAGLGLAALCRRKA